MNVGNEANLTLPDGWTIDYLDAGDPSGRPVFFQPGSPNTRIMGKLWHRPAEAAGVRLIGVSRPGGPRCWRLCSRRGDSAPRVRP